MDHSLKLAPYRTHILYMKKQNIIEATKNRSVRTENYTQVVSHKSNIPEAKRGTLFGLNFSIYTDFNIVKIDSFKASKTDYAPNKVINRVDGENQGCFHRPLHEYLL